MSARPTAGSNHCSVPAGPKGLAWNRSWSYVRHGQSHDDKSAHRGVDERDYGFERGAELGPQPVSEQLGWVLPGSCDAGDAALLGLRKRRPDLVARPAVGQLMNVACKAM